MDQRTMGTTEMRGINGKAREKMWKRHYFLGHTIKKNLSKNARGAYFEKSLKNEHNTPTVSGDTVTIMTCKGNHFFKMVISSAYKSKRRQAHSQKFVCLRKEVIYNLYHFHSFKNMPYLKTS